MTSHDVIVIGAGPAGLATSRELQQVGVDHVVVERGDQVGYTWAHLYDGLVLHTAKRFSSLPGLRFDSSTPTFPRRADLVDYMTRYVERFRLPIETNVTVSAVQRGPADWIVRTTKTNGSDEVTVATARAIVVASGIVANPSVPAIANRDAFKGRVMHSVDYRRPDPFRDLRVLVVGAGNSAADVAVELANVGATVTIAIRSGARTVPLRLAGIPIQHLAIPLAGLPKRVQDVIAKSIATASGWMRGASPLPPPQPSKCRAVPLIGFHLAEAIKSGKVKLKSGIAAFTDDGVQFTDRSADKFDLVILATGFRPALGFLGEVIHRDECGFAMRRGLVESADHRDLFFVGHNYDLRGGLFNISRDARLASRGIRDALAAKGLASRLARAG
jgi:indole-3-pyruvate monooxygenase